MGLLDSIKAMFGGKPAQEENVEAPQEEMTQEAPVEEASQEEAPVEEASQEERTEGEV